MEGQDNHQQEIDQALQLYDCVVDVNSIRYFKLGWNIFGNPEFRYMEHYGRVVALVGTFKSGKTWLVGRLLGIVQLKGDPTSPTPGLCIKVPPQDLIKRKLESEEAVKPPTPQKVTSTPTKPPPPKGRGGPPPPKVSTPNKPVAATQSFADIIPLDTAGTERPTFSSDLIDVRATECFLRDLVLRIAPRAIFVTSKFERQTQISINSLITQFSVDQKKTINSKNKLIVVHNYRDVHSSIDLQNRIQDVRKTFLREPDVNDYPWLEDEIDEAGFKTLKDPDAPEQILWLPVTDNNTGFTYFETTKTCHIFIVDDDAEKSDNFDPKSHNDRAIKAIISKINGDPPIKINLIDAVLKFSETLLQKYINGWDQYKLRLDKTYDIHRIMPALDYNPGDDGNGIKNSANQKQRNWEEPDEIEYEEDFWYRPFQLPTISFTDTGIISGNFHELPGEMYHNKDNIQFWIEVPHFNNSNRSKDWIQILTNKDRSEFGVKIKLRDYKIPEGNEQGSNGFRRGVGTYSYDLSVQDFRYNLPKTLQALFTEEHMIIEDGILKITLEKAQDFTT